MLLLALERTTASSDSWIAERDVWMDGVDKMCIRDRYTEDVGGILTLEFEEDGTLEFKVTAEESDYLFDEIGSVLKIKQYQMEKRELLEALEMYYRVFYLGEEIDEEEES